MAYKRIAYCLNTPRHFLVLDGTDTAVRVINGDCISSVVPGDDGAYTVIVLADYSIAIEQPFAEVAKIMFGIGWDEVCP